MKPNQDLMPVLLHLRAYKGMVGLNLFLIGLMGITEIVGLGMIIPILESLQGSSGSSIFTEYTNIVFGVIGITPGPMHLLGFFAVAMAFKYAIEAFQMHFQQVLHTTIALDLRCDAFNALMRVPVQFFIFRKQGELITTVVQSPQETGAVVHGLMSMVAAAAFCALYFTLNLLISWELTLFASVIMLIGALLVQPRIRKTFTHGEQQKGNLDGMSAYVADSVSGIKSIRTYQNEDIHNSFFGALAKNFQDVAIKIQHNRIIANLSLEPVATFTGLILTVLAITALDLPVIMLMTFFLVLMRMIPKLKLGVSGWLQIAASIAHFEKVKGIINMDGQTIVSDGPKELTRLDQDIRLDHVTFSHDKGETYALRDVSFEIKRNTMVALVGESGSGKSTLVDLLVRHYIPLEGRIQIGDENLNDLQLNSWRQQIGIIEQNPHLFNDTIRANIAYGLKEATEDQIKEAARAAHADEFISTLPQGYDTIVSDRGARLSGGQVQRVALARALIRKPSILILDEATSALDSDSERHVQDAITKIAKHTTIIAIAHRLSTIRHADNIVLMQSGQVVDQGTHDELLERSNMYKSYVSQQFSGTTNTQ